ncbi:(Fe-S)-binding protein [Tumebacillus sp. ITR2]|uniref:Glycolate oxidase iron-sulfur subunit n=2 Tax=Tumebacillus amylolyticus TaxID=2801339 RepID=A0ABS1JGQ1_9BACL|nr:(Fe-S)-binding protein [Tumebacillus amylolyticus]
MPNPNLIQLLDNFDREEILNCMQCGFCLPACPTYRQTGKESASPRGRIALMKGVVDGQLNVDAEFEDNMYLCLGCRACETACPAGVPYGSLLETARDVVERNKKDIGEHSFLRDLLFEEIFPNPDRIDRLGTMLWASQTLGLQKLANKMGLINLLPRPMREMQSAVDQVASPWQRMKRESVIHPEPDASQNLRVGMFKGCIMDVMFFETNQATARVLTKAGCEVVFVEEQACCGALHAHSGEQNGAKELAKRNIEAFEAAGVDLIVNNAGGCGAALKEYHHWFHDDPQWQERAMKFVAKCRDANELAAELFSALEFRGELPGVRITYQDSCHLAHGQGVRAQPRQLLRSIPGVEYVEMMEADRCCGSAGIYNITNFDMSMEVLDEKMENVKSTSAHLVVTSNPGCLLQMRKGIQRAGCEGQMEAVHIMDLLDRVL